MRQALPVAWLRAAPAAAVARCSERVDDRLMAWSWAPTPLQLSTGLAGVNTSGKAERGRLDNGHVAYRDDADRLAWHRSETAR